MNVSFIGSGNLAWHLAPALDNLGYVVKEVYSRNARHAAALSERLYQAEVKKTLDFSSSPSRIFMIAVHDDAISGIAREIVLPDDSILVHTSGSQPLSLLEFAATERIGVFYPLQTFTKTSKVVFNDVPIFVECSEESAERILLTMARALSKQVRKISSEERKAMHIAAVFASNFSNHMMTISRELMEENKLDFAWLKSLILETLNKALTIGPAQAQTGPAKRGDLQILDEHMAFLQNNKDLAKLYELISQHIIDKHVKD